MVALAFAGCGTGDREDDAGTVTERFHAALRAGDGQAACDRLNQETASKLEKQERKPCDEAILSLDLPKRGTVTDTRVYVTSALATLAEGGSDFLDEGPDGWRVSAAGSSPPRRHSPTTANWRTEMRAMFVLYLCLIVGGILFYSAIGLIHN